MKSGLDAIPLFLLDDLLNIFDHEDDKRSMILPKSLFCLDILSLSRKEVSNFRLRVSTVSESSLVASLRSSIC